MDRGWESWGCSAWRREGCVETSEQLPGSEGATRNLERNNHQELERQDKGEWSQSERGEV